MQEERTGSPRDMEPAAAAWVGARGPAEAAEWVAIVPALTLGRRSESRGGPAVACTRAFYIAWMRWRSVMGRDTVDAPPTNVLTYRPFTNVWQLQDGAWRMIARHAQVIVPR